jgi:hypothetical protein
VGDCQGAARAAKRKAANLAAWHDTLLHLYGDRVLAFDVAAARVAGELSDFALSKGLAPGFADIVIGATARTRQLIILTQNIRHFAPLGTLALNPFQELPA